MSNLFQSILNLTPIISVMIVAIILMRFLFSGAPKKLNKILWMVVGIRSLFPISFSSSIGIIPDKTVPFTLSNGEITRTGTLRPNMAKLAENTLSPNIKYGFDFKEILPYIWICGVLFFLAYMIFCYIKVKMFVADSIPCGESIFETDRISTSFVMGAFKPRIYLNSGTMGSQRDLIIAHERCHLKNKDNFIKLFGFIILGLYWFNPLMWVGYWLFCKDIALACDEEVIKMLPPEKRKEYAIALLESSHKKEAFIYGTAFNEIDTKER